MPKVVSIRTFSEPIVSKQQSLPTFCNFPCHKVLKDASYWCSNLDALPLPRYAAPTSEPKRELAKIFLDVCNLPPPWNP
ncbi:unnamed protein product [Hymenolepis diminuta]|uniref:Uncharacterized protein n=1 Tax=Hymenolepis diminuta TaxID=6216 RepID=A0A564ZFH1_HYMDI|nr:unnamed protein product [Hymenolepis diminuta]